MARHELRAMIPLLLGPVVSAGAQVAQVRPLVTQYPHSAYGALGTLYPTNDLATTHICDLCNTRPQTVRLAP